jgi:hypothetical protein
MEGLTRSNVHVQDGRGLALAMDGRCSSMVAIPNRSGCRFILRLSSASRDSRRPSTSSGQREGHVTLRAEEGTTRIFGVYASN